MELNNVDLLKLMTKYMQKDKSTQGFCHALNPKLIQMSNDISIAIIYNNIDILSEDFIDELAWQFHVDFYDVGSDLATKRKLVQDSILIHRKKGTPYAVKKLIEDVFGYGELKEWFQYAGTPYTFRVAVDYTVGTAENIVRFHNLIDSVINVRSKLEAIELSLRKYVGVGYEIYKRHLTRNTKLGLWRLGTDAFATVGSEEKIK